LVSATGSRGSTRARWHARWVRRRGSDGGGAATGLGAGRWAVLRPPVTALDEEEVSEALARQYLRRYGVLTREVLTREPQAPPWRDQLRVLRRLEMRGEIRGGRLVAGFVGEQFALPEALESLRAVRRETENGNARRGELVRLSACDPLNLAGILTPGDRITATLGHQVLLRDGVPEAARHEPAPEENRSPLPGYPDSNRSYGETSSLALD
jgi:ATP-dependent Lhr-like helicase